jgi:hypothetical protein
MLLVTCFECGRKSVKKSGPCPECHRFPLPFQCKRCGQDKKRSELVDGICRSCHTALALEELTSGEHFEVGLCRSCRKPVTTGQRPKSLLHDEVWSVPCPHCGHRLEWDRCTICRGIFYGPLAHVKWVERGYDGYRYSRDLCVCDNCLPIAEKEMAACLTANAKIDLDYQTMAVMLFVLLVPLAIVALFLVGLTGNL